MDLDELERRGHIKRLPIDVKKIGDSLNLAKRDVNVAKVLPGGMVYGI